MSDPASSSLFGSSGGTSLDIGTPHTLDPNALPVLENISLEESESISTSLSPHIRPPDSTHWDISVSSDASLADVDESFISQDADPSDEGETGLEESDEFIVRVCDSNFFRSRRATTTPIHSHNNASTRSELLATPREGKGATAVKDPDYGYYVLLEMDRKYTEMDTAEFLEKFVDAPRMTKSQLKKAGDFSDLAQLLERKNSGEKDMYPILVRTSMSFLVFLPHRACSAVYSTMSYN